MMLSNWEVKIRSGVTPNFYIYVVRESCLGTQLLTKDGEIKEIAEGYPFPEPTLRLPPESCKSLVNELFNMGIAPDGLKDTLSELKATKYHLEDLRKLIKGLK